jgi:hypothetical protein
MFNDPERAALARARNVDRWFALSAAARAVRSAAS